MAKTTLTRYFYLIALMLAFLLGSWSQDSGFVEEIFSYQEDVLYLTGQHIELVMISGALAILIAIPLGVVLSRPRFARLAENAMQVLNVGTTIPTLAVLALSMSLLGIGTLPAVFGLCIASLLPIVRNTYIGLCEVPAHLKEAAAGIGMTPGEMLMRVELPNALFVIFAGIRTALAINVGTAPLAFLIGGGSYSVPRAWRDRGEPVAVTVAEIDPEVTRAAQDFFWYDPGSGPGADRIVASDARRLLRAEETRYDVVIGDAFGDIAVPPHLITREFFELVRARLNPGGVYVMNVIDHMDRLDVLAAMVQTARTVWPVVEVWTDPRHDPAENRRVFVLVAGEAEIDAVGAFCPPKDAGRPGLIALLYVDPSAQGRGHSSALLSAMEAALVERGVAAGRLTATTTARDFYLRRGWQDDGPAREELGVTGYPMRKDLR